MDAKKLAIGFFLVLFLCPVLWAQELIVKYFCEASHNLAESWTNKEGWGYKRSAYSGDGKLLTDQWGIDGILNELSIAYLAEENSLYIDGVLYYKKW